MPQTDAPKSRAYDALTMLLAAASGPGPAAGVLATGLSLGLALSRYEPETAARASRELEGRIAVLADWTPEEIEVRNRNVAAQFREAWAHLEAHHVG